MKWITAGVQSRHHPTVACSITKVGEIVQISSQTLIGSIQMNAQYVDL
jgi:hypothetical protein